MNGKKLIESMNQAIQIGEGIQNGFYNVHIPETVDVKAIRARMGLSQSVFTERFGISLYTLQNW